MEKLILYSIPIIVFVSGCMTIYFLNRYYLNVMTDYFNNSDNKSNISFSFNPNSAYNITALVTFFLFIGVVLHVDKLNKIEWERHLEKESLLEYKETLKEEMTEEIMKDITEQYRNR